MLKYILPLVVLLIATPTMAKSFAVDPAKSKVSFTVLYNGQPVTGVFGKWDAKIDFDAANLPGSSIAATIYPASAKTGEAIYDGTLPSVDWLDAEHFPKALYTSTSIEKTGEGHYTAHGILTLKGKALPLDLPFTLTPADGGGELVAARGEALLDRFAANIGLASDPKGQWVAKDVKLAIEITAH